MAGFTSRLIGATKLDVRTYEEVEADTGATGQAMVVVLLSSLAAGVGSMGFAEGGAAGLVVWCIAAAIGWAAWAFLTYHIGTRVLPGAQTRADVGELLRTTGFAQAAGLLRVLGLVPVVGRGLWLAVWLWLLAAMVVGVRQALDYDSTARAVSVCLLGWILSLVFVIAIGLVFGPTVS